MNQKMNPPMGWNSYDYYDTAVTEADVKANADFMAQYLKPYGWEYIVVDIEWYSYGAATRRDEHQYIPFGDVEIDEYSRLLPCPERFPSCVDGKGFKPLADYIHSLGLKFGIHIMRGVPRIAAHTHTAIKGTDLPASEIANPYSICYWNPDMYGVYPHKPESQLYYDSLMELYAEWGVDFIKCDDICRMDAHSSKEEIVMLHKAIEKCGREILLSLSPGPAIPKEAEFYHENATMWRITDDFWDSWHLLRDMFDRCKTWEGQVKPGGYPDCDMLPVGTIGKGFNHERLTRFTKDEQMTMMTLWCMVSSPLMLGAELPKLDEWTLKLLTNQRVLDLMTTTKDAKEYYRNEQMILWKSTRLDTEETNLAIFNISEKALTICPADYMQVIGSSTKDLWTDKKLIPMDTFTIPAHGVLLLQTDSVLKKTLN